MTQNLATNFAVDSALESPVDSTLSAAILPVYRRADVMMQRGDGVYLFDENKKRYLDFASGIAVMALGHGHPHVLKALQKQAKELWYCSNLFQNEPLVRFSERLVGASFASSVFCCSSGAEAVESAIKFIRRYHSQNTAEGATPRSKILVAQGGFHGRTLAALSASSNSDKVTAGYAPLLSGFQQLAFDDIDALELAMEGKAGSDVAAIMLEPIQGEGGVRAHSKAYLKRARELATEKGALLYLDEVQCGLGRTGTLFAYEAYGVTPDLVSIGKAIGNGYPLAACLVNKKVASAMEPGCHGSTYGSNPLAMAVGNAVLDVLMDERLRHKVRLGGKALLEELEALVVEFPQALKQARGTGMMIGLETHVSAYELSDRLRDAGLLVAPAGDNVIRILPPLVIEEKHTKQAVNLIKEVLTSW